MTDLPTRLDLAATAAADAPEGLPYLDAATVAALLPYADLVDALAAGHRDPAAIVERIVYGPPGTSQNLMALPAWQPGRDLGIKIVTIFPDNPAPRVPSIQAVYVLFDGTDGRPLAVLDGTELTYRKTAADSALGSWFLSRDDAATLLMVGAGGVAPHLIAAHRVVRPSIERVLIWNRNRARAEQVAATVGTDAVEVVDDLDTAVTRADIICSATMTKDPLIHGERLTPGTHLDLVGSYLPSHREIDDDVIRRAEIYVDSRLAPLHECGDLVIPLERGLLHEDDIRGDLYELARGEAPGRSSREAITAFENGGGGHLDLMAARLAWGRWSSGGAAPSGR